MSTHEKSYLPASLAGNNDKHIRKVAGNKINMQN